MQEKARVPGALKVRLFGTKETPGQGKWQNARLVNVNSTLAHQYELFSVSQALRRADTKLPI